MTTVTSTIRNTEVVLDNGVLRVRLLPSIGGKMSSLVRLASGHEFLLQGTNSRIPTFGDRFEDFGPSGFDECLPTVSECRYQGPPFADVLLPDHGEVWSAAWQCEQSGHEARLSCTGQVLPYQLTKRISLKGHEVSIEYEITNRSDKTWRYLWSAHPLLTLESGARIVLPPEVTELLINSSRKNRLGKPGQTCGWPFANVAGNAKDELDVSKSKLAATADKLYTGRLHKGFCALFKPQANESITFRFDTASVPYAGLWLCYGGWPEEAKEPQYTVALEPCNGRPDSLADAIAKGECATISPGDTQRWWLRIEVRQGAPSMLS